MATKKEIKPIEFVVDITDASDAFDVYYAFACAKIDSTLNTNEAYAYDAVCGEFEEHVISTLRDIASDIKDALKEKAPVEEKKPNVFKRLWNWITGK